MMATHHEQVQSVFKQLKSLGNLRDAYLHSVPLEQGQGFLLPVCFHHIKDQRLIETFAAWRSEHSYAFPSQFKVTVEGTGTWLKKGVLENEGRLLFLVVSRFGEPVGHLGYANAINDERTLEVDNVVRGSQGIEEGIMANAMLTLIRWGRDTFDPGEIYLRVFKDNDHAVAFYHKLGFLDDSVIPLRKYVEADGTFYRSRKTTDTAPADKEFLRMIYSPNKN